MAILTGLGSLLGGLSNTQAARTGTTSSTGATAGSSATSSMPVFNQTQTGVQNTTAAALQNEIANGPNITPMATSGTNAINNTYKGIGDRLQQSLSSRGFGNSGASGTAALQTEIGRGGAVGDLQSNLQSYALQQQQAALAQGTSFGFAAPGTTGTGSTAGTSTMAGTNVVPGSVAAGSLLGGMGTIQQQLNQAIQQGGLG